MHVCQVCYSDTNFPAGPSALIKTRQRDKNVQEAVKKQ